MTAETRAEGFALSSYQRRCYRLLTEGFQASYRARCLIEVIGLLDVARLERALFRITSRHEILRTRFERVAGLQEPIQVIASECRPRIGTAEARPWLAQGRASLVAFANKIPDLQPVGAELRDFSVHVATEAPDRH